MKQSPKNLVSPPLKLRFFDLDAIIHSDSKEYIDNFARMYKRFQAKDTPPLKTPPLEFMVLTNNDNEWGQPVMILDGLVQRLRDPKMLIGYIYDGVLNTIIAKIQSHILIHAGVVSINGEGLILAADSGHGKTTLVLELVQRGFKFLSDEMAALNRVTQQVDPFPRTLRIRSGSLEMAGFPPAPDAPIWLGKSLLDIEQIKTNSIGQKASIKNVVILQDPTEFNGKQTDDETPSMGILVDHLDENLLAATRKLKGVVDVQADIERGYPTLRLFAPHRMRLLAQIEAICQEQGVLILDISKRVESRPTFDTPARLEAISKSEAVMELLKRFQPGHKSVILQTEFGGRSTQLFMALASIIGQANCYRLFVGPLKQNADLVSNLMSSENMIKNRSYAVGVQSEMK